MVYPGLRPRRRRAVTRSGPLGVIRGVLQLDLWRDRVALVLLGLSVLGIVALVVYVYLWIPALPPLLPLHYNGSGSVDLIGLRTDLYKMPAIGSIVLLADLIFSGWIISRERYAALTLLVASVLVQVMLIVATMNLVRLAFGD